MAKNIQVAKIVASTTPNAWAQAYHAGNLTAVICVTPKGKEDATSLHIVGKDLLNTFESEYFTIEDKNLTSIKHAVETTYKKSAETHNITFLVAAALHNTLYVVLAGNGSVYLMRKGKIGTLLEQQTEAPEILSSSGFLEDKDSVVLASPAFLHLVNKEKLFETLSTNSPADAAEMLTPTIHAASDGDAAALFFNYEDSETIPPHKMTLESHHLQKPAEVEKKEEEERMPKTEEHEPAKEPDEELPSHTLPLQEDIKRHELPEDTKEPIFSKPLDRSLIPSRKRGLSHRRKLLLTILVILIVVLGATSYFAITKQQENQRVALFNSLYPPAEKKYEEAQGLMDLNVATAKEDLTASKQQLEDAQSKFPASSPQAKQIADLLSKIDNALTQLQTANTTSAEKVDTTSSPLLAYAASHTDISYLTQDATNIYTADNTAITQITKKTQASKKLVSSTWGSVGGFETYLGNFYLLDTKTGIFKFASGNYAKSNYFATGVTPDLSSANSIAIDGSIWVLENTGTILKFTKGKQDSLTLSGLDKQLSSPTRIVTTVDDDNVYILDNGNGRIVVIDKTGKFVTQYANSLLKKATQLVVDEKNKKALFLSSGSVYQLSLQ